MRAAMNAHRSFAARADIETILADLGAARMDVPVLQPADPFLDTAGEELRRRIFLTASETGETLCLRPEFTIPVCLAHLEEARGPSRHGYVGTVFRQRRAGGNEFLQAGIEDIGDPDWIAADARAFADASEMLGRLGLHGAGAGVSIVMGDQSVFDAVLAALGLPAGWRLALAHDFGNRDALAATLARLGRPAVLPPLPAHVKGPALAGDRAGLIAAVGADLEAAGLANAGSRGAREIAARLLAKVEASRAAPDEGVLETLRAFLAISVPLADAVGALQRFADDNRLAIAPALDTFSRRVTALSRAGLDPAAITCEASFGRRLDYYTGLVFEFRGPDGEVLAGGGRYDRLLTLLGAPVPMPGVGFSVWLDRVAALAGTWPEHAG